MHDEGTTRRRGAGVVNTRLASEPHLATISDVARLAGVSIKTVSRVANGQPNVRESTRARVQEAIDALRYRANPDARALAFMRRRPAAVPSTGD